MSNIQRWGDAHQYDAETFDSVNPDEGVKGKVTIVSMSPDPLGEIASFNAMYEGKVIRSLSEVTDEMRAQALEDVQATHLKAPLEAVKIHMLFEGVDRAFTHQLIRQRTAVYAQESMRFAVLGDLLDATTLPPALAGTHRHDPFEDYDYLSEHQRQRIAWDEAIMAIDKAYHRLVENGVPAEEARGLLPHATATRIHMVTDLRNLSEHSGNRLCTQAQFHWKGVWSQIVSGIRDYPSQSGLDPVNPNNRWSFEAIADSNLFRPACYLYGHCPFKAKFDRSCSIRDRVDDFARHGTPSKEWHEDHHHPATGEVVLRGINPAEWLLDPSAARKVD